MKGDRTRCLSRTERSDAAEARVCPEIAPDAAPEGDPSASPVTPEGRSDGGGGWNPLTLAQRISGQALDPKKGAYPRMNR